MTVDDVVANGGAADLPQVLAFYLPQFHQVPENDAWHGTGFTEWTVVARSRPLFPGHRQPHEPGELGFYDLRVPEVRERQAHLARSHGVSGFLYYHYWFRGRRMLERPFQEVLASGRPDFPFALCWANESWFRRWQKSADELLVEQEYDEEDDLEHIRWLIAAFEDPRYIRVHDRPLLAVYRPHLLPDPMRTFDLWRKECAAAGLAAPWFVMFETDEDLGDPAEIGFDASAEFVPHGLPSLIEPLDKPPGVDPATVLYDYGAVSRAYRGRPGQPWVRYPCVATDWDNSPRRQSGEALILRGSTPELYGEWLDDSLRRQARLYGGNGIVFLNAWNEWAEGAHLEPDAFHGRAYLQKTREVVEALRGSPIVTEESDGPDGPDGTQPSAIEDLYADLYERFVRLQAVSSGLLSYADRRQASADRRHREELCRSREEGRRLATAVVALEEELAFARARYDRLLQSSGSDRRIVDR